MDNKKYNITPVATQALLRGDFDNFMVAATPGGIERQEAQGQQSFVNSTTLPIKTNYCSREDLEQLGIVFGEVVDDLFINATLSDGWTKKATDHPMWSDLLDDKGRKRAAIFYKAAFYDRSAHIQLIPRFNYKYMPVKGYNRYMSYEELDAGNWHGVIYDQDKIIFRTEAITGPTWEQKEELQKQAKQWLIDNYPDYQNPLAYWD